MTTIRQMIQSSPAHANELFAKLVDTSENAVKTREKLFAELKGELAKADTSEPTKPKSGQIDYGF